MSKNCDEGDPALECSGGGVPHVDRRCPAPSNPWVCRLLERSPRREQRRPAHARVGGRGAMPVHERELAYTRQERGVPRISSITNPNLDYNQMLSIPRLSI